ncbi:MAG TPA: calcium-translocating P-type ATPase, PMCA-type [Bacteroidales bacterium]|nr:calcium-translocating P-type ATPase, PMCA-type [Bacteroidales bacterium]HRT83513.1 calcium-translocating P-type ATPase, PMCA-type [Bacteroidales bacterium]
MDTSKLHSGLSISEVEESRKKFGSNVLTPPKRDPLWKLFLLKFNDPIIRILLVAAFLSLGISFVHNEFVETIGIFCAIFLATGVSFWFEMDASKKFDILNQVNDETLVKVIRDGNIREVPKKDIVVGDIILLDTGEEVPADATLIEAVSLSVNESTLTGEPVIEKSVDPAMFDDEATYPTNNIYRGTTIVDGHCIARVFAVGDSTEYGKVAQKSAEKNPEETPLNRQLDKLAKFVGFAGFVLAVMTFAMLFVKDMFLGNVNYSFSEIFLLVSVITGVVIAITKIWIPAIYDGLSVLGAKVTTPALVRESDWSRWVTFGISTTVILMALGYLIFGVDPSDANQWISIDTASRILNYFMVSVTLIVVAMPEGLPMSVTLSLAMSMKRMLQTNNLVRKMHATETMGATTVICTDKTGTLTQNQMRVAFTNFVVGNDEPIIMESIAVNSTAFLEISDDGKIKALGNPTEAALLLWLHDRGINYLEVRNSAKIIDQLTFSTERKYMATLAESASLGRRILFVKGAPEIVASKCISLPDGLNDLLLKYQNQAMRTLAFAYKEIPAEACNEKMEVLSERGLTYLGMVAIADPVRPDVPDAVAKCLKAGIDVKIVTGDTPRTAWEIGRQIGIINDNDGPEVIITGVDFEALTDEEALDRVMGLKIMCRARPIDKQRLVQLLQKKGAVVAVTGDGTNDAPALNYAHVGLSMGSGTSVAKEASDITLLDDSFNSIATAVMWGRSLYQNIQRFILFQLTINFAALLIVFIGSLIGKDLPLTVTQMLWVNLIMDTFAAGALASLPPDERVMERKPRKADDFIITKKMAVIIITSGVIFVVFMLGLLEYFTNDAGEISRYDSSRFFTFFVMLQFWNMFNAKRFGSSESAFRDITKSKGFLLVGLLIVAGQVLIVQFGGDVFRTEPISLRDWVLIILITSLVLIVGEAAAIIKRIIKK